MDTIFIVFFSVLGASLGSFLNVVAARTVSGDPWWGGARSKCPKCGAPLGWKELIPVVSWLVLKGKCRCCKSSIPPRYLAVELFGAATAGLLAWRWGPSAALAAAMTASFGLFLNALTDIEDGYVFDVFPCVMGAAGLILRLLPGGGALLDGVLGGTAGFAVIAVIIAASKGGMGWGDATLAAGTGVIVGWKFALLTLYLGFMTGGVFSLVMLAAGKIKRKDSLPLVPFLAFGGLLTLLFGPGILDFFNISPTSPWF